MDNGAGNYSKFLAGDESAFSKIIDEYHDNLIFFINRIVNNIDTAEELAAESFADLIIHPGRFKGKSSFKTFLFTVAHHKAVDFIRHESRYKTFEYDEVEPQSISYQSFENSILDKEDNRQLVKAMDELNDDYRTVLHLIYFEEMSYEEAAKIMKKNKKQIDNLVYRAKKSLKDILEKGGFSYAQ